MFADTAQPPQTPTATGSLYADLELVVVVGEGRDFDLDVLALPNSQDQLVHLASNLHGVAWHVLPVVEDALGEILTGGLLPQRGDEAEGLGHRQVRLDLHQRRALARVLLEHTAAAQIHAIVHAAHGLLGARDLHEEDGLLQRRLAEHLGREARAARGRHNLPCAAVDGVGVQGAVGEIETDAAHVLLAQGALLGGPLEGAVDVLLDFEEVLDGLRDVNDNIGALSLWTPAPDLARRGLVPVVLLTEDFRALLRLRLWAELAVLDILYSPLPASARPPDRDGCACSATWPGPSARIVTSS